MKRLNDWLNAHPWTAALIGIIIGGIVGRWL